MLLALSGLVAMFDFIELLRRSATQAGRDLRAWSAEIAALRLPYIAMQILPFAVLLGGILCFWRLTRSSELIVARAAGVSAWEFLAAPMLCALLLGVHRHGGGQPGVVGDVRRAPRRWTTPICRTGGGPLALTGGQLWLRQSDRALAPQGVAIIHAHGVELHGKQLTATRGQRVPSGWRTTGCSRASRPARRRSAAGAWELENARDDPPGPAARAAAHDQRCRPT